MKCSPLRRLTPSLSSFINKDQKLFTAPRQAVLQQSIAGSEPSCTFLNKSHQLCNHTTPDTSTMAEGFNGMAMDQPAGTSRTNPYAAESWLEPWLIKHSEFYRKHLTRDGRRESKSTRRHSIVAEGLESRKNSDAVPEAEAASTDAIPAPAENPRRSVESGTSEAETRSKKEKAPHGWRKSVGWFPHP